MGHGAIGRRFKHQIAQKLFHDAAQTTRTSFTLDRLFGDSTQRILFEIDLDIIHLKQLFVLLDEGVFRLPQDTNQRFLIQRIQRSDDRNTTH